MESLRNEILTLASQAAQSHPETELFSEITNVFRRQDLRLSRPASSPHLVEFVVDDVIRKDGSTPGIDLYNKIETLHNRKVSMWMSSYMHLLRIFGNESVHERYDDRLPSELTENDFHHLPLCLNRVLRFRWIRNRNLNPNAKRGPGPKTEPPPHDNTTTIPKKFCFEGLAPWLYSLALWIVLERGTLVLFPGPNIPELLRASERELYR